MIATDSDDDKIVIAMDKKNVSEEPAQQQIPNENIDNTLVIQENINLDKTNQQINPQKKRTNKSYGNGNGNENKKETQQYIYSKSLLTRNITLPITVIGRNIKETIENVIYAHYEGKCLVEGYIKPKSSKIITFSSGVISGDQISFEVVFECMICNPVEGMNITCKVKNITKAGIRAESALENPSPIVVFVARDHHFNNNKFLNIHEDDIIQIRVIGQRFELNDSYISIIGELINTSDNAEKSNMVKKPRIVIEKD
jgi:DNA-directed RNA polymerase subunit E'/Rpb7